MPITNVAPPLRIHIERTDLPHAGATAMQLVLFTVERQAFALPLDMVLHVVAAAYVTPLPGAPRIVLGVLNLAGRVLPVLSLRARFQLPERELEPHDQFLVTHTTHRDVILAVDQVTEVIEISENQIVAAKSLVGPLQHITGIVKLDDQLILIQDLERALTLDELRRLDNAAAELETASE